MSKINISFNDKNYKIKKSDLTSATSRLQTHLSTTLSGSGSVINLGGNSYNVDSTKLTSASNKFSSYLNTIKGNGSKVTIGNTEYSFDSNKVAGALTDLHGVLDRLANELPAGLYRTGAIDLYMAGEEKAAKEMLVTPWEELESNGVIMVSDGSGPSLDNLELNEYGFCYGVEYAITVEGLTLGFTFKEDGSVLYNEMGTIFELPAGIFVYGDHVVDMTALDMPMFIVSPDGTSMEGDGFTLTLSGSVPPKGTIYLGTTNGKQTIEGDLVLCNDGRATELNTMVLANQELLTGVVIPDSITNIAAGAFQRCESLASIIIPNGVKNIDSHAFSSCPKIRSVMIPDSVTSIGEGAFWGSGLNAIVIPNSVVTIGEKAFYSNRSLNSITLGKNVTTIGNEAFANCLRLVEVVNNSNLSIAIGSSDYGQIAAYALEVHQGESQLLKQDEYLFYRYNNIVYLVGYIGADLELSLPDGYCDENYVINKQIFAHGNLISVVIPDGVAAIGDQTFYGCSNLESVVIGKNVAAIGYWAFGYCNKLNNVTFAGTASQWHAIAKESGWAEPSTITHIQCSDSTVRREGLYNGDTFTSWEKLVNQGTVKVNNGVVTTNYTSNGISNTSSTKLKGELVIPSDGSITSLGTDAFYGCEYLTGIDIPNSVINIDRYAFGYCKALTSVTIPDSITQVNINFSGCYALTYVVIPASVTNIAPHGFEGCSALTNIIVADNNPNYKSIDGNLYSKDGKQLVQYAIGKPVTEYTIPEEVTHLGGGAFRTSTKLTSIVIPEGVVDIGDGAFYGCSNLSSVDIAESVTNIGMVAFFRCISLSSIVIPNGVTTIGIAALSGCTALNSVSIPSSVVSIAEQTFSGDTSLINITFDGTIDQWNAITKGDRWNSNVPATYVQCTDGTAAL